MEIETLNLEIRTHNSVSVVSYIVKRGCGSYQGRQYVIRQSKHSNMPGNRMGMFAASILDKKPTVTIFDASDLTRLLKSDGTAVSAQNDVVAKWKSPPLLRRARRRDGPLSDNVLTLGERRVPAPALPTYKSTPKAGVYFNNGGELGVSATNVFNLLQCSHYVVVTFESTNGYPVPLIQASRSGACCSRPGTKARSLAADRVAVTPNSLGAS